MQVIFLEGMTASGKSGVALTLAEKYKGCIVNCDSVQCYDEIRIGAAIPTDEEFQRVPHFLYRFVKPFNEIAAGEYAKIFFSEMKKIEKSGFKNVFVVGGTGFYFQAIEKGMLNTPPCDPELRKQLEEDAAKKGFEALYQEMLDLDPALASKIHPNDHYRILRALEILRVSNKSLTDLKNEHLIKLDGGSDGFPYPLKKFAIDISREELLLRIEKRTDKMLAEGLLEEVESLIKKGLKEWAPLKSVGYSECLAYLEREIETVAELREAIIVSTRQLAKKQKTWFVRDPDIKWVVPEVAESEIQDLLDRTPTS
jgi:tRNA dimethylallyltransferase